MIDLHTHSAASDGSLPPAELIEEAEFLGIQLIALTDHDTVDGVPAFLRRAAQSPLVEAIGGVEISVDPGADPGAPSGKGAAVHLLGYGVGEQPPKAITRRFRDFRKDRKARLGQIIERLNQIGVEITREEVIARRADGVDGARRGDERRGGDGTGETAGAHDGKNDLFGRPHIAAVLVDKGLVPHTTAAFRKYLGRGARAYIPRQYPGAAEMVKLLRENRLVPVLAHPGLIEMPEDELNTLLRRLRDAGLVGLETYYSGHSEKNVALCQKMAARYGLISTGGSDFHGDAKPTLSLGKGYGDLRVPETVGENLRRAIQSAQSE